MTCSCNENNTILTRHLAVASTRLVVRTNRGKVGEVSGAKDTRTRELFELGESVWAHIRGGARSRQTKKVTRRELIKV